MLDEAANAGRGRLCWTRPPMLDEAFFERQSQFPFLRQCNSATYSGKIEAPQKVELPPPF